MRSTIPRIIKTSIITAFTITAALIWKDVITETIDLFVPKNALAYKFVAALVATMLVVIAIYVVLKTEQEAELALRKFRRNRRHKRFFSLIS